MRTLWLIASMTIAISIAGCGGSSSRPSSDDRELAKVSACTDPLTPKYKKNAEQLGYNCAFNAQIAHTFRSARNRTFRVDYDEFNGLEFSLPEEGVEYPIRAEFELVRSANERVWGLTLALDRGLTQPYTLVLPVAEQSLLPTDRRIDNTIGITTAAGHIIRFNSTNLSFGEDETSISLRTVHSGFMAPVAIRETSEAPIAYPLSAPDANEDTATVIPLTYTDLENDLATNCEVISANNVTAESCACTSEGICEAKVQGTQDFYGMAEFEYAVVARGQESNRAKVSFKVLPVDDRPTVSAFDAGRIDEGGTLSIVLPYEDIEADPAESCSISPDSELSVNSCNCASGVCTAVLASAAGFSGQTSFSFNVTANGLTSESATAVLTIDNIPVASDFIATAIDEDTDATIALSYTDANNHLATACAVAAPANLTVISGCSCDVAGACSVTVRGLQDFNGNAQFSYSVTANGLTSTAATVTVPITPVDDPPVVSNQNYAVAEDGSQTFSISYTDVDGDLANQCTITTLSNLTESVACQCTGQGVCTWTAGASPANYHGAASFVATVRTTTLTSAGQSLNVTVTAVDDPPVTTAVAAANIDEDTTSGSITLSYTDVDGDAATSCSTSNLNQLTVQGGCSCNTGTCTVRVRGASNYHGNASLDFTVSSNGITSNASALTITINPVDDAPTGTLSTPAVTIYEDLESGFITLTYQDVESDLATGCALSNLNHVLETTACSCSSGTCTVKVTGAPVHYFGSASFDYTVTANGLTSIARAVNFSIVAQDDAPVASDFSPAAFNEDTASLITLDYSDVEGDKATSCSVTPGNGNISVTTACACSNGTCQVGITGAQNYHGAASFSFTVTANGLTSNSATASLTINPVDDAPVASNVNATAFDEDTSTTITLAYDIAYTDVEGDKATSCTASAPAKVSITTPCSCDANGDCTVGVTGSTHANGSGSITFLVTSLGKNSNTATASFTINPVNDVPVANAVTDNALSEDVAKWVTLSYTEHDGEKASSCAVSNLTNITESGACSCDVDGLCRVQVLGSPLNYNGAASFSFTVTVGADTSNSATASLTIQAVDDPPVAQNISPAAFDEDTASLITLAYTDVESHQAAACTIGTTSNVTVTTPCTCNAGVCQVGVTGTSNYFGAASFTYVVRANGLDSNSATATLTINAVDDAPVASNFSHGPIPEETEGLVTLVYSDVESDQATACSVTPSANLTVSTGCSCTAGVCQVGVTGVTNFYGNATFTFSVTANGKTSNTATATVTVSNVDDAPTVAATQDGGDILEDVQSNVSLPYTDPENDAATACAVSGQSNLLTPSSCTCSNGSCTASVRGTLNYNGPASFEFTVTANGQTSNSGTVTLDVLPVDDAPVAANISPAAFDEDTNSPLITLSYTDIESDLASTCTLSNLVNVTMVGACTCSGGVCQVRVLGNPTHYNGAASFSYTVTANGATSNTATASLTVTPVNDSPDATNPPAATVIAEDTEGFVTLTYNEYDGEKATSCATSNLVNLTVVTACSCNASGVCTVGVQGSPLHFNGSASLDFTVSVGADQSDTATAAVTITPVDDAPVANNFSPVSFNEDTESEITLSYTDVENDPATVCTVTGLTNISVTSSCACSLGVCKLKVKGTPLHYFGAASFLFTVTANSKVSNQATASLTIDPVNDSPTLNTNQALTVEIQSANNAIPTAKLSSSDVDDTAANLTYRLISAPQYGTLKNNGSDLAINGTFTQADLAAGNVTYTHTGNDYTSDSFQFSVADDDTAYAPTATNAAPATFVINITPIQVNCADYTNATEYNSIGLGTTVSPYQICSALQLADLADNCNSSTSLACDKHFRLQGNINMQNIASFAIIGSSTNPFTGSFDGNGKTISNLSAGNSFTDYAGFFGYVSSGAVISKVVVKGSITGRAYAGGLVAYNTGTLSQVGFSGTVTSSADNAVVGGLVGYHSGSLQDGYAQGTVNASGSGNKAGGLVGSVATASVSTSYANAAVNSSGQAGGLVGTNSSGTYTANYWDTSLSTKSNAYSGTAGGVANITGMTTPNMKLQSSFSANWNFTSIWNSYDYVSPPRLRFEQALLDCVAAGSHFYDTDATSGFDACYYPSHANCEGGTGMGIDSNLDGVLDGCLFLAANNQTCSATCSAKTTFITYSSAETARVAGQTSLCEVATEKLVSSNTNYVYHAFANTTFASGSNQLTDAGCFRSDNPDGRFFDYSFIVTSSGTAGLSASSPNAAHPFITNEGGNIRRVCGCTTQ